MGTNPDVPGFEILGSIGAGASGWVYRAKRKEDGLPVAVKVLRPEAQADPELVARFRREERILARLASPYLVRLIGSSIDSTPAWIVTELLEGGSLSDRIRTAPGGRLSVDEVVRLASEASRGLELLHGHDVLHRDVKPSNMLFRTDGTVVLTDLGLAKMGQASFLTQPGQLLGSVAYMAPELFVGAKQDQRTDLFSLGVSLYEALTGLHPTGRKPRSAQQEVKDPALLVPACPEILRMVLLTLLHKDPLCRPVSAKALVAFLDRLAPSGSDRSNATPAGAIDECGQSGAGGRPVDRQSASFVLLETVPEGPPGYVLQEQIGTTGLSTIYRARHTESGRETALKIHPVSSAGEEQHREEIVQRIETLRRLSHPHLLTVQEGGWWRSHLFLATPLVRGETLRNVLLSTGKLPSDRVKDLTRKLLAALVYLHGQGVVHGRVEPGNVMIDSTGGVTLMEPGLNIDPGLARLTSAAHLPGTALYAAPETIATGLHTFRTDLYQMGATLYEALTGLHPYGWDEVRAWFSGERNPRKAILQGFPGGTPATREAADTGEDASLAYCFAGACAVEENDRYESALVFEALFERISLDRRPSGIIGGVQRDGGLSRRLSGKPDVLPPLPGSPEPASGRWRVVGFWFAVIVGLILAIWLALEPVGLSSDKALGRRRDRVAFNDSQGGENEHVQIERT